MKKTTLLAIAIALLAIVSASHATIWKTDQAHTTISFLAKYMGISNVRGDFNEFDATVDFDESNPATFSVDATAQAASINTRNEKRDGHLKSPDFFDAENHPQLKLVSKKVEKIGDGRYKLTADLTMRGVTKEVVFDVTGFNGTVKDMRGGTRTSAAATATINRKDWGLDWNRPLESGGWLVSEDITIMLDVQLVKEEG